MTPQIITDIDKQKVLTRAIETLKSEGNAVLALCDRLDSSFTQAVELILNCKGRLVVTGMGKSGAVGKKIAGTFSSTGTPSLFLHLPKAFTAILEWLRQKMSFWRFQTVVIRVR